MLSKVLGLSESTAKKILLQLHHDFADRHRNLDELLMVNFDKVAEYIPHTIHISLTKKMLIGSYFTMEYSISNFFTMLICSGSVSVLATIPIALL